MTTTVEDLGTILGVWAHPDDEAYLMAGTAMLALGAGAAVACITATLGEAGESADEEQWPQRRLAEIRREEMRASLAVLGITDHEWLHFPDGGLDTVGSRGADVVASVAERVRPDTIMTFGADGMTGHPDHVVVGDWAEDVARRLGDVRVLAATKVQAWYDEHPDVTDLVFPDGGPCVDPADVVLEVTVPDQVLDRKMQALRSQASQTSGLIELMGADAYRSWIRMEYWVDR